MGLVQRIDLPPSEQVDLAVVAMMPPLRQAPPKAVMLIGFESRQGQSRPMLDKMADACRGLAVEVTGRIIVRGGRWFDLDCDEAGCPSRGSGEGAALPSPSEVPAVAEFVGREICPLPDRLALAGLLEPSSSLLSLAVSRLADEWWQLRLEATLGVDAEGARELGDNTNEMELYEIRTAELAVWSLVLGEDDDADGEPIRVLPPQDLAMLAVSLTDLELRDGLIAWLCPGSLPRDRIDPILAVQLRRALAEPPWLSGDLGEVEQVAGGQRVERRLCELSAALPDVWAVPTLTLLASFTWWRGDGALTRIALDRALRIDPDYRLAQLLERMVDLAIRPERASA
jgi:hypothetical protein